MLKRNFILLIAVLGIALVLLWGFFYFNQPTGTPSEDGGGTNFFSNLNPFRRNPSPESPVVNPPPSSTGEGTLGGDRPVPKLKKVSSMPVAGYTPFLKERYKEVVVVPPPVETTTPPATPTTTVKPTPPTIELATALRYVDRATGNIFQTFADKIDERKFSSTLIPAVYETFFGSGGGSVLMRYLKTDDVTVETFFGTLPKELLGGDTIVDSKVSGYFLPQNITDLSLAPDATKAFYLVNIKGAATDTATGVVLDMVKNTKTQIFDSPFTEWLTQWPNARMITLTTKPSFGTPGYMYAIDPGSTAATRGFSKVLGGVSGLTTLTSPNGKLVLYADNNLSLSIFNTSSGEATATGLRTMPEKCVWSTSSEHLYCAVPIDAVSGQYPDSWYRGEVSFSDQIWKISAIGAAPTMLINPILIEGGEDADAIKLMLDVDENYLFYVNKKDSFLWELELK